MTSSASPKERPERSLAEFFADIEDGTGPSLTPDDHRALVAAVRPAGRCRTHRCPREATMA